eukprot:9985091-Ditylum_brightwellii.AAC.1
MEFFTDQSRSGGGIMASHHMVPPTTNKHHAVGNNISLLQNSLSTLRTMFFTPLLLKPNTSDLRRCQPIFNKMPDFLTKGAIGHRCKLNEPCPPGKSV